MSADIPMLARLSDYPEYYTNHRPDNEAIVLGDRRLNYRDFAQRIDQCAKALLVAGVSHGDRVATLSNPHPDALVIWLACARIGAIWVGLNTRSQYSELAYIVSDAQPTLLFSICSFEGRDFIKDIDGLMAEFECLSSAILLDKSQIQSDESQLPSFESFLQSGDNCEDAVFTQVINTVCPDDPALVVYTSGSTGQPKGALLSHHNIIVYVDPVSAMVGRASAYFK